jgi:hypothetical protein
MRLDMLTWFICLLVATVTAFKFVAVGTILVALVAIWGLLKLGFRMLDMVSARAFGRRSSQRERPVFRYENPPIRPAAQSAPVVQPAPVVLPPPPAPKRSSSWSGWTWVGLGIVAVAVLMASQRTHIERRYVSERPRPLPADRLPRAERGLEYTSRRVSARAVPTTHDRRPATNPSWSVLGRGKTLQDAKDDAYDKAWAGLLEYDESVRPPIEWRPSIEFVRAYLEKRWGPDTVEEFEDPVGAVVQIPLEVEVTPGARQLLADLDHELRVDQRMGIAGKLLAVVVAVLAAIAGYIRMDEWTKGFYTRWLRTAAVAFVVCAGAGLWMVLRR